MYIEKYELTKKNKYNVYLSNGEVLTLDERVITENELLLKKELNSELYDKVINESVIKTISSKPIIYHDKNVPESFQSPFRTALKTSVPENFQFLLML